MHEREFGPLLAAALILSLGGFPGCAKEKKRFDPRALEEMQKGQDALEMNARTEKMNAVRGEIRRLDADIAVVQARISQVQRKKRPALQEKLDSIDREKGMLLEGLNQLEGLAGEDFQAGLAESQAAFHRLERKFDQFKIRLK